MCCIVLNARIIICYYTMLITPFPWTDHDLLQYFYEHSVAICNILYTCRSKVLLHNRGLTQLMFLFSSLFHIAPSSPICSPVQWPKLSQFYCLSLSVCVPFRLFVMCPVRVCLFRCRCIWSIEVLFELRSIWTWFFQFPYNIIDAIRYPPARLNRIIGRNFVRMTSFIDLSWSVTKFSMHLLVCCSLLLLIWSLQCICLASPVEWRMLQD